MNSRLKKGLGRGLSSLLGDSSEKIDINKVLIKDLTRNKLQPRKHFDEKSLDESKHAENVAKYLKTDHHNVIFGNQDIINQISDFNFDLFWITNHIFI